VHVPEKDVPPLNPSPKMLVVPEELNPEETPLIIMPLPEAPVVVIPVAASAWAHLALAKTVADVPDPTVLNTTHTSNTAVSITPVPTPKVMVPKEVSDVDPLVPQYIVIMGVAVPAPVLTMSNLQ